MIPTFRRHIAGVLASTLLVSLIGCAAWLVFNFVHKSSSNSLGYRPHPAANIAADGRSPGDLRVDAANKIPLIQLPVVAPAGPRVVPNIPLVALASNSPVPPAPGSNLVSVMPESSALIDSSPRLPKLVSIIPSTDVTSIPTTRPPVHVADLGSLANDVALMDEGDKARRFVMSMCKDLRGNLWVGCEDSGVWRFDPSAAKGKEWTQFTSKDGLGDDNCYAIACDRKGRIWCGHLSHGVSVYNGTAWKNYEAVGGLSRPDTLSGALGERIFHITVDQFNGDVWMCSSAGLARYSESKDTWQYYTRAECLPSDQASSIAFDAEGNAYLATQCDGIAMADAKDEYKTWRQVTGPEELPTVPVGDGLPTNLINDVLVAKDGTVYAATDAGLAFSRDKGKTWRFERGADWADKVRGLHAGPPKGWIEKQSPTLAQDYVTCLSDNPNGSLDVGYLEEGLGSLTKGTDGIL